MQNLRLLRQKLRASLCAVVVLFATAFVVSAQTVAAPVLSAENVDADNILRLDKLAWKFRAGDNANWARADFDDANWKSVTNDQINRDPAAALENWRGRGWFRLQFEVDESLINQPLALRVWHWGAAEVYLDNDLIRRFGAIETSGEQEYNPRGQIAALVFARGGQHTIAFRQSFAAASDLNGGLGRWLARADLTPGFRLEVQRAETAARYIQDRAETNRTDYFLAGVLFALAFVHFLLFAFYSAARGNLFYSLFVACVGALMLFNRWLNDAHWSALAQALMTLVHQATQATGVMFLLAFLRVEFAGKIISKFFLALCALWAICLGLMAVRVSLPFEFYLCLLVLTLLDAARILVRALALRAPGAWNIAAGIGAFMFGVANNVAFERKVHFLPESFHEINVYITLFAVPVAVSIYLARSFARTNKNLQTQLVREVEHEKERARLEIVEAENRRRAAELEEARQLQLSLLPRKLPQLPDLEIAAYMKPASEVGGDYYDFHVAKDGTLTVAVGDATGHGLKAGSIVTATKSLFLAFAEESDVRQTLKFCSAAIKKMNLRGMFMALALLKIKNNRVSIAVAGMPPALVYRAATETIEEYAVKALPLGAPLANYETGEFELANNDLIVLMSDGFPEMFNDRNEILGFDKAARILPRIADKPAHEIVAHLIEIAREWANGRPQDDDVTFVVLKVRGETVIL